MTSGKRSALKEVEKELGRFFFGPAKRRKPDKVWGFRYGPETATDAPIYGPFATAQEAQRAAEAAPFRKADRAYGWAAERIRADETPKDPSELTEAEGHQP